MEKEVKRSKKVHIKKIVVLVVTVLVAMGLLFWQIFFQSKNDDTKNADSSKVDSETKTDTTTAETTIDPLEGWLSFSRNGISLKYPPDWTTLGNEYPESHIFTNYFGNQSIELDRISPQTGFIGFTLVYFQNGYNYGIATNAGASEYVSSSTDLEYFLKEMNGVTGNTATKETMQIGGIESIRFVWNDITTPWGIKGSGGIYTFNYILATDVDEADAEETVNQILDTVEFINI